MTGKLYLMTYRVTSINTSVDNIRTGTFSSTLMVDIRGTSPRATGKASQVPWRVRLLDVSVYSIDGNNSVVLYVCNLGRRHLMSKSPCSISPNRT